MHHRGPHRPVFSLWGLLLVGLLGCERTPSVVEQPDVATVEISPSSVPIEVFRVTTLSAVARNETGVVLQGRAVRWHSQDSEIAGVTPDGVVTAVSVGITRVIAEVEGVADTATVGVLIPADATLSVSVDSILLAESASLVVEAALIDTQEREIPAVSIEWSSGDPDVLAVDSEGMVSAVAIGQSTLRVTAGPRVRMVPARVTAGYRRIYVSAWHTCAIRMDGRAYCWGLLRNGRLGIDPDPDGTDQDPRVQPHPVQGNLRFVTLTLGEHHTCGIMEEGDTFCWGANFEGALGSGRSDESCLFGQQPCSDEPVLVVGGHRFEAVTAGEGHTCGMTTEGEAYCWGLGRSGQVGNPAGSGESGPEGTVRGPVPVVGDLTFQSVDAGMNHHRTHALTRDGQTYVWGRRYAEPDSIEDPLCTLDYCFVPRAIQPELRFQEITVAREHVCGLVGVGSAFCWRLRAPIPQQVAASERFVGFAASNGRSPVCAFTSRQKAHCWSFPSSAEAPTAATPLAGDLVLKWLATGWTDLISIIPTACGVTPDNLAYCWFGDLATTEPVLVPDPVQ